MSRSLTPQQLVEEFKKTGEFDRLRQKVLSHFLASPENEALMARVKGIATERLESDKNIAGKTEDEALREILQELERYPIVDRALEQYPYLKDDKFTESLSHSLQGTMEATSTSARTTKVTSDRLLG